MGKSKTCKKSRRLEKRQQDAITKSEHKYWSKVSESDVFDVDHLAGEHYPHGVMRVFKCKRNDYPLLITLYAKMGLHRYNMLQGTNLQLHRIEKYNREGHIFVFSYYITLVAGNPATRSLLTFQTSIHESEWNKMDVRCYVARVKDTGTKGTVSDDVTAPGFYGVSVPKWPEDDAVADKNRFYVVQEPELKENDWIRLYLELGFVTTNRRITNPKLSDLKIVEVMVETKENVQLPNERLKGFKDATFYIKYDQDLGEGQVCKRRAVIRRSVDLRSERMRIKGDYYLESDPETSETDPEI